jgi:hypothetical protein
MVCNIIVLQIYAYLTFLIAKKFTGGTPAQRSGEIDIIKLL